MWVLLLNQSGTKAKPWILYENGKRGICHSH